MTPLERLSDKMIGAKLDAVDVCQFSEHNRGLVAARDLKPGEVVTFVPREFLVTREKCRGSEMGVKVEQVFKELQFERPQDIVFATFLMEERLKQTESNYYDYIETLPKSFDMFPLLFEQETNSNPAFE
jgi:hypothetical protein